MNQTDRARFGARQLLQLPRWAKRALAVAVDMGLCVLTVWLALCLRLEQWAALEPAHWVAVAVAMLFAFPVFVRFGLYRAIFRFASWNAMLALVQAMAVYGALYAAVVALAGLPGVPRSVGLIQPLLLLVAAGGSRVLVHYWLSGLYRHGLQVQRRPGVLVYGAGSAGRQLAAALAGGNEYRLMGFLDDDQRLWGNSMDGRRVYNPAELGRLITKLAVSEVLLAIPSVSRQQRLKILDALREFALHVRTLPGLADLASGRVSLGDVHELDIEDLLGREPVVPNGLLLNRNIFGKVVLVTGAGGSIGSELCRQIVQCRPRTLLLVDMSEFALYQIHQELLQGGKGLPRCVRKADAPTSSLPGSQRCGEPCDDPCDDGLACEIVPLLASVSHEERMHEIMDTWHPHTVYHAAAYKHVPMVEHNPAEGVRNNVWGTWVCAQAAARHGVQNFVLVSTDKAVRPTNLMGASKRLAEMVLQGMATLRASERTCFSMVRFGNVLDSSGSVVPLFRKQIKNGGPITLTHVDITRYFMTIPEAALLVIQAGAMAVGGDVFVLDMGQPVRIFDLARRMVELSGLALRDELHPNGDIGIEITGLRPGEKLYEELLIDDNPEPTQHARIMKAHEECLPWLALEPRLKALQLAVTVNDVPVIKHMLQLLVPGYQPTDDVVDWVYLEQENEAVAGELPSY